MKVNKTSTNQIKTTNLRSKVNKSQENPETDLKMTPTKRTSNKASTSTNKVAKTPSPNKKQRRNSAKTGSLNAADILNKTVLSKHLISPPQTSTKTKTPTKRETPAKSGNDNEFTELKTPKREAPSISGNDEFKELKTPKRALIQNLLQLDENKSAQKTVSPKRVASPRRRNSPGKHLRDFKYRPPLNTVFDLQEYLDDLEHRQIAEDLEDNDYKFLKQKILGSKKIVVVTGAGISVASGIPDFRSQDGIFKRLKEKTALENDDISVSSGKDLFDFNFIYSSPKALTLFNDMVYDLHQKIKSTKNTDFHSFLDNLAKRKTLKRCYTQNVDGFESHLEHLTIKHPISEKKQEWPNVVQLHGSINHLHCIKCRKVVAIESKHFTKPGEPSGDHFQLSDLLPNCSDCEEAELVREAIGKRSQGVGKLRSNIILYNEEHPESEGIGRVVESDILSSCDLLIICGTTLKIPGVKRIVREFSRSIECKKNADGSGGAILWLGNELPSQCVVDYVEFIDLVVLGDCQKFARMTAGWFGE